MDPGLILKGVSFSYGNHWSLDGISFGLDQGELMEARIY